jgi:hypothetical protein
MSWVPADTPSVDITITYLCCGIVYEQPLHMLWWLEQIDPVFS